MHLQINGEAKEMQDIATVGALVEALALDMRKVAVEVNLAIVPRSQYALTKLHSGDSIEIVQFIGGG